MKKDYVSFNNWVFSKEDLTLEEGYFMQVLFQYHNIEDGYAFPSYETLKKVLKTNRDAKVSKIIKSLVKKGFISVSKHWRNNCYFIIGIEKFLIDDFKKEDPVKEDTFHFDGLTPSESSTLMKYSNNDKSKIEKLIDYAKGKAECVFAYVLKLLKNNVNVEEKEQYKSSGFSNFQGRGYTSDNYKSLEDKLLDNNFTAPVEEPIEESNSNWRAKLKKYRAAIV